MNTDAETSNPSSPRPTGGHGVVRWMRLVLIALAILCAAWAGQALIVGDADSAEYRAVRKRLRPFLMPPGEPRHRVLLVGWDGATFDMIDPLAAAGHLPNVRRMMDRGVSMELESTIIPISSAAWTSAMTGKNPSKTGIFSFFKPVPGSYAVNLISAADRRAAPLWRIMNHFGLKTIIVGVPITYPPETVDGVMIAGMLSPLDADYAWPKGLADALRSLGFVPDIGIWRKNQEVNEPVVVEQHARKTRIMRVLLEESDWDMTIVVFKSLDVVKHRVYQGVPGRDITEHYQRLDDALGQLIQSAGPNTDVLLMSDHGFGMYDRRLSINGCLVELGLAALSSNPRDLSAGVDQPFSVGRAVRHLNEIRELNMSGTRAFCYWYEGNYAAVRVNLRGREPQGIVAEDEYESVVNEIREELLSFRLERDGPPVFARVERFGDVYPGPYTEMMPDLLIEADRKYQCRARYSQPVFTFYVMNPIPDHELTGVLVAAGPSIGHDARRGRGSVMDIAPTVMQLFSLPPFTEMDGRVLVEIFKSRPQLTRIDEPPLPPWVGTGAPVGNESDDEVIERLRALGYVGDTEDEQSEQE